MTAADKRVAELEGVQLDYWVGRALGASDDEVAIYPVNGLERACYLADRFASLLGHTSIATRKDFYFCPSTDWVYGGPIIEREKIMIQPYIEKRNWHGIWRSEEGPMYFVMTGDSALQAAMRTFVASKFGGTVKAVLP